MCGVCFICYLAIKLFLRATFQTKHFLSNTSFSITNLAYFSEAVKNKEKEKKKK